MKSDLQYIFLTLVEGIFNVAHITGYNQGVRTQSLVLLMAVQYAESQTVSVLALDRFLTYVTYSTVWSSAGLDNCNMLYYGLPHARTA